MRYISILSFLFLLVSCKVDTRISTDLGDIKRIEIIPCYSLQETYDGFLKLNEIIKKDPSWLINAGISDKSLLQQFSIENEWSDYPLFSVFKPSGYFNGQSMTFVNSAYLGMIDNGIKNKLLSQLTDTLVKHGFPTDINFFYIPSPFIDTMSVLIGSKTKDFNRILGLGDLSAFGFQKIKSYDSQGNLVEEKVDRKSFMPYLVFKETGKSVFSTGEYLLKLTLKDTIVYKSLDRSDMEHDTVFFETLLTQDYIKDNIK